MSAGTMDAIVVERAGGPEAMTLRQIDVPEPGPGQAAVQVAAAGVNFIDVYERSGVYQVDLPLVPGVEGAGTVVALGDDTDGPAVGTRVAWAGSAAPRRATPGAYAQYVVAPAEILLEVPDAVSDEWAAALPLQGLTAHYLATDCYQIRPGDSVLVHAGAGGVGLLLTKVAKIRGARVITTVSTAEKAAASRAAGADEVLVGYTGFTRRVRDLTGGAGVAAVYDGVGKDTFDGSLDSLAVRGTLVLFGGSSGQVPPFDLQRLNRGGSLSVTRPTLGHFIRTRDELAGRAADLFGWLADGSLTVTVGGSYPLAEAARAHADLAARRTTGKLVLVV